MVELNPSTIAGEIEKTGYPLELRTAAKLERADGYVAHNLYYVDRDESKGREIDLRWLANIRRGPKEGDAAIWVRYCLSIECKKASKPWVCLTSPHAPYDQELDSVLYKGLPRLTLTQEQLLDASRCHPLFNANRVGRSYFEAFKGEDGEQIRMFGALATAVKATLTMHESEFAAASGNSVCFYYPLVVLAGRLFEGRLEGNDILAEEVGRSVVSYSYASPAYGDSRLLVPIVTIDELDSFVADMDTAHEFMADIILAAVARGDYKPKSGAT